MSGISTRGLAASLSALMLGLLFSFAARPATAAITEELYEQPFMLACAGIECKTVLPKVAIKTNLNIRQVSCVMNGGFGRSGILQFTYDDKTLLSQYMPAIRITSTQSLFIQNMDILIVAQKSAEIRLRADDGPSSAFCTLTGRLQKIS